MSGLIAIVGRPNVGKSALFNRIVGKRIAIVHDEPGVTRDRISVEAEWRGHPFTLVDTGGIGLMRREKAGNVIMQATIDQTELAIKAAHVIILVVNVQEGVVPLDREVAERLRLSGKPVLVAINKVDNYRIECNTPEFVALGFEKMFPVSAIHGLGVEAIVEAAFSLLPAKEDTILPVRASSEGGADDRPTGATSLADRPLKLAVIGRPNVGKSSIINALTQSERVIVSPIPGTTRDAVDVPFEVDTDGVRQQYILIDTAGVRQQSRISDSVEFYSVKRTEDSIARCDIAILMLDAEAGITAQDKKVAGKIVEERKACIVVVNKWDLVSESVLEARKEEIERRHKKEVRKNAKEPLTTLGEFGQWVQKYLFFLDYAPVLFTSATTGFNLDRLLEAVRYVTAQLQQTVQTALLNRTLYDAIERRQPVSAMGHRVKFFYATQVGQAPPVFLLFVNRDELFSDQYTKYLTHELRKAFGFEGCPIVLVPKPRPKTVQSIRKFKIKNSGEKLDRRHSKVKK
jgi:GTP-binding protein